MGNGRIRGDTSLEIFINTKGHVHQQELPRGEGDEVVEVEATAEIFILHVPK